MAVQHILMEKVRGICRGFLYAYLWLSKGHYLPVKKSEVTF